PRPPVRPTPSVAQAAPMPDPDLSADLAEQLLEPTTSSAVKHAFSRLSGMSMVNTGVTIEEMMRDLLRPMLKEWLDENLPAIVERMVEKEIARLSRGVE
ncbi:PopZ family protein, partial [Devosia sp.]|uniref:PopZ family protein n=1 Tax=Devosia sp. TaxID=1871048 RepID=UPI002F1DA718